MYELDYSEIILYKLQCDCDRFKSLGGGGERT